MLIGSQTSGTLKQSTWIWQHPDWPRFTLQAEPLAPMLRADVAQAKPRPFVFTPCHGFEQAICTGQYQAVTKISKATATRHLGDLLEKGCLVRLAGGGRSARYQVNHT